MTIYVLDTDHLSLYGRNHPNLITRLLAAQVQLTTTAINVEEQLRGLNLIFFSMMQNPTRFTKPLKRNVFASALKIYASRRLP